MMFMEKIAVIQVDDKYGCRTVRAPDNTLQSAALQLLRKRVEEGHWYHYPDDAQAKAEALVELGDGNLAWQFLVNRRDHEYEWVESQEI